MAQVFPLSASRYAPAIWMEDKNIPIHCKTGRAFCAIAASEVKEETPVEARSKAAAAPSRESRTWLILASDPGLLREAQS
jgi:hypothetical protein